jgi:phage gpG-like protein
MQTTLNIRALHKLAEKINERLEIFREEVFQSEDFPKFKEYSGRREGLMLALHLCEEVEKELNA